MAGARLLVGPTSEEIAAALAEADLAVGAGGVSTWERCCLGLPTVLLVIADNQRDIAQAVAQAGAAVLLGHPDTLEAGTIYGAIKVLAGDADRLRQMAECAAAVCDGTGADRVADVIEQSI